MTDIRSIIAFPAVCFLLSFCRQRAEFDADVRAWCRWRRMDCTRMSMVRLFVSDRAFRNLFYYRLGPLHVLISWLFRGYDTLQITTPRGRLAGGLIFQHGFATIVSAERIGRNCKIYQQVTIGYNHKLQAPSIGDNVEICCGAKVIGGVRIGSNVLIGANAVVVSDVPDNSIVAGVPARVIGGLNPDKTIFDR